MNCLFCKMVEGEIPTNKVYEDDELLAFRDINPQAPTHILIIPKKHIATLNDTSADDQLLLGKIMLKARELAAEEGLEDDGYRVVLNCNSHGGQSVYHIHLHLLGGRQMAWPPG
ncbi:histidine triad nucleotide-binding protein [Endozoicomonas gorgoniicola]|uniref:Histidine triad nucleotide-binding protein n=1 Tax=Endozoicomonas gorgoniicola TaxID=1234144 RepID=A0ABT3MQ18_9GAMM|nr:histidine triad nucleotide-binding protein [Endozoicomonas gorgoniicola]MCW7551203.1 histidine triad nucleotide-binding protein [Endozoicomonas gorgoniicola]